MWIFLSKFQQIWAQALLNNVVKFLLLSFGLLPLFPLLSVSLRAAITTQRVYFPVYLQLNLGCCKLSGQFPEVETYLSFQIPLISGPFTLCLGANSTTKAVSVPCCSLEASWSRGINTQYVSHSLSTNPVGDSSSP